MSTRAVIADGESWSANASAWCWCNGDVHIAAESQDGASALGAVRQAGRTWRYSTSVCPAATE